jgi:hypothetical protein
MIDKDIEESPVKLASVVTPQGAPCYIEMAPYTFHPAALCPMFLLSFRLFYVRRLFSGFTEPEKKEM